MHVLYFFIGKMMINKVEREVYPKKKNQTSHHLNKNCDMTEKAMLGSSNSEATALCSPKNAPNAPNSSA
jgi:hypothetical protein